MKTALFLLLVSGAWVPYQPSPCAEQRQAVHDMEILVDGVSKKAWPSLFEILRQRREALKACLAAYGERDA